MQNTTNTVEEYNAALQSCREIFLKKTLDYGTSWRVLRTISVMDQLFIKAKRIRTIQENKSQKVGDDIASEFKGILNYAVIGLIQLNLGKEKADEIEMNEAMHFYDSTLDQARALLLNKNHDYGEAWREMSQESFTDLILSKLFRIRQILLNDGRTILSEGIDAGFYDIINYAAFALILIKEGKHSG